MSDEIDMLVEQTPAVIEAVGNRLPDGFPMDVFEFVARGFANQRHNCIAPHCSNPACSKNLIARKKMMAMIAPAAAWLAAHHKQYSPALRIHIAFLWGKVDSRFRRFSPPPCSPNYIEEICQISGSLPFGPIPQYFHCSKLLSVALPHS